MVERSFAPLSSGLLARKGEARPAMRPQTAASADENELGWNDLGLSGAERPVVIQQREALAAEFGAAPEERIAAAVAELAVAARVRKAAFTLRLDPDRHLRLRLACAVQHRSAQAIVIEALDSLLATLPAIDAAQFAAPPHQS